MKAAALFDIVRGILATQGQPKKISLEFKPYFIPPLFQILKNVISIGDFKQY